MGQKLGGVVGERMRAIARWDTDCAVESRQVACTWQADEGLHLWVRETYLPRCRHCHRPARWRPWIRPAQGAAPALRRGHAARPPRPRRGTVPYADAILAMQTHELAAIGVQARGEGAWMNSAAPDFSNLGGPILVWRRRWQLCTSTLHVKTKSKTIVLHHCHA